MFNNTRKRLAVLNTVVFILILAALGALLYGHMRYRLIREIDEILNQAKSQVESYGNLSKWLQSDHLDPEQDERTIYLFWDEQGRLLEEFPKQSLASATAEQFSVDSFSTPARTQKVKGTSYRVLTFPRNYAQESGGIVTVSVIRSMEDVSHTLHSLMGDIWIGVAAGAVVSILAGLFLAGRALIPIRNSWDKQQRFVADASHELRTPTAIIQAQTELLLRYPAHSIEEESPHIAEILKESKRMTRLLDDLLTLARSDSNQLQIQPSLFTLDSLLGELTDNFRLLAAAKRIKITAEFQEPLILWGDESRIRQLLIILLENALK